MIQNNQTVANPNQQQISKISDRTPSSGKFSYSRYVEDIDKQDQSQRKQSFQENHVNANLFIAAKGPKTEHSMTTVNDDVFQKSENYSPRYRPNDIFPFAAMWNRRQSEKNKPGPGPNKNFLGVNNLPEFLIGRGKPLNKVEEKSEPLKQSKVKLGQCIVASIVVTDKNNEPDVIDEASELIENIESTVKGSHFHEVKCEPFNLNIWQQFQQPKKDQEIRITVTPDPRQQQSRHSSGQDNVNSATFMDVRNSKPSAMKSQKESERAKRLEEASKGLSIASKSQAIEYFPTIGQKRSKTRRVDNNMIQSKIITQSQIKGGEKRNETDLRSSQKQADPKKAIIQVAERMKSTVDPKLPSSEFRVLPVPSNLSQPDKHSVSSVVKLNEKLIELPSPSQESPQNKENETNMRPDFQEYLIKKIHDIERIVDNIRHQSFSTSMIKCEAADHKFGKQKRKKGGKQSDQRMIPDDFLNGLSSIDSDNKSKPYKKEEKNQRNNEFDKKFQFLAERILKMEEMLLKKTSKACNCDFVYQQQQAYSVKPIKKQSYKNSDSQTKILKKVKSETKILEPAQEQSESDVSDEDFIRLQDSVPKLHFKLQRNSSPQDLAELGIQILNAFRIKTQRGDSMDMLECENGVQFFYSTSNVFIRLQYNGRFYIGNGESSQEKSQFMKEGQGIEVFPGRYIYQGQFHQDKKVGEGIISYKSGERYKGYWSNDVYEGYGILYTKESKFKGNFSEGNKDGIGREIFKNGDKYEGYYSRNNYNGAGKYFWSNGTIYYGTFENDQMSGQGIWKSSSGDSYEGQFYKGKRHGQGRYTKKSGQVLEGQFQKGNLIKRQCKGVLPPQRQLAFESSSVEGSRGVNNDYFGSKFNSTKGRKFVIEKQLSNFSPLKSKKYSTKW